MMNICGIVEVDDEVHTGVAKEAMAGNFFLVNIP